jgi:DNA replication ATP-dependent helicase Dna2
VVAPDTALPPLPSPDTAAGVFVNRLCQLVIAEAVATRAQAHALWHRPLRERVAAGRAIDQVRVESVGFDGMLTLTCRQNESRFREGDVLILSRGNPLAEPRLLVTLETDEETELVVSTEDPASHTSDVFSAADGWVLDEGYLDFSNILVDALNQAADTAAGRERVLPLLMGTQQPQIDMERYALALERAEAWGLNDEQADGLASAYASTLAYLIQGPPGTGKTVVLARLAQLLAEEGERVLVTAFTHRAINNALNKLADLSARDAAPIEVVKIGARSRSDDLQVDHYATFELSPLAEQTGGYVVGATPFATRTRRLTGVAFDTVIFDEASQITLPLAIMAMLAGTRFIFIGDQRQLPPVLATRQGDDVLHESVFSTLVDRNFDLMLEETYRMNAALTAWPSEQFYESRLRSHPAIAERRMAYPQPPARLQHILDPEQPLVFVDLQHVGARTRSAPEAQLVVDLITTLLACGVTPDQIGVVAPYRAQGRAIRSLLRQALPEAADLRRAVVVDTVERMQGQERDLVILSLTTSDPVFASEIADFLFQAERLNVAITRPRSKLIIVGSRQILQAAPTNPDLQQGVAFLRDLLDRCPCVSLAAAG